MDVRACKKIQKLIADAELICIGAHTNPDGDAWGSTLALTHYITQNYADKHTFVISADDTATSSDFDFLQGDLAVVRASKIKEQPDLFIACDVPNSSRLNKAEKLYKSARATVVFDHHIPEDMKADAILADEHAASTGVVIYRYLKAVGAPLTPNVAQCLYATILTDTAQFMNLNTSAEVFSICAELTEAGADPALCGERIYQEKSLTQLKTESLVMSRIAYADDKRIAYSYLTQKDMDKLGATKQDTAVCIDLIKQCREIEVAIFLREIAKAGDFRVSMRAINAVDVSKVAKALGGGGHKAAAGCTVHGSMQDVLAEVISRLEMAIDLAPELG